MSRTPWNGLVLVRILCALHSEPRSFWLLPSLDMLYDGVLVTLMNYFFRKKMKV